MRTPFLNRLSVQSMWRATRCAAVRWPGQPYPRVICLILAFLCGTGPVFAQATPAPNGEHAAETPKTQPAPIAELARCVENYEAAVAHSRELLHARERIVIVDRMSARCRNSNYNPEGTPFPWVIDKQEYEMMSGKYGSNNLVVAQVRVSARTERLRLYALRGEKRIAAANTAVEEVVALEERKRKAKANRLTVAREKFSPIRRHQPVAGPPIKTPDGISYTPEFKAHLQRLNEAFLEVKKSKVLLHEAEITANALVRPFDNAKLLSFYTDLRDAEAERDEAKRRESYIQETLEIRRLDQTECKARAAERKKQKTRLKIEHSGARGHASALREAMHPKQIDGLWEMIRTVVVHSTSQATELGSGRLYSTGERKSGFSSNGNAVLRARVLFEDDDANGELVVGVFPTHLTKWFSGLHPELITIEGGEFDTPILCDRRKEDWLYQTGMFVVSVRAGGKKEFRARLTQRDSRYMLGLLSKFIDMDALGRLPSVAPGWQDRAARIAADEASDAPPRDGKQNSTAKQNTGKIDAKMAELKALYIAEAIKDIEEKLETEKKPEVRSALESILENMREQLREQDK